MFFFLSWKGWLLLPVDEASQERTLTFKGVLGAFFTNKDSSIPGELQRGTDISFPSSTSLGLEAAIWGQNCPWL